MADPKIMTIVPEQVYPFSFRNKLSIIQSTKCLCFSCLKIFKTQEISTWTDNGNTAKCPHCSIDSIIGDATGAPMVKRFAIRMYNKYFAIKKETQKETPC